MGRLWWGSRCALLLVVVPAVVLPGGVAHAGAARFAVPAMSVSAPRQVAVSCEGVGQVLMELPDGLRADGSIRVAGSGPVRVAGAGRVTAVDRRTGQPLSTGEPAGPGVWCDGIAFSGFRWAQLTPVGTPLPAGVRPEDALDGRLLLQVTVRAPAAPEQGLVLSTPSTAMATARFRYEAVLANYLTGRPGTCAVAVRMAGNATPYVFTQWSGTNVTASVVKVDIMATLFWQAQNAHRALTSTEQGDLTLMIEQSDNAAATRLWNEVGQGPAVTTFNRQVPMPATTMGSGGLWGLTATTAPDQVGLLARFSQPNTLLTEGFRLYGLWLLHHVVAGQAWGVSAWPPTGAVALKNGWLPRTDGWHVNSIGVVASTAASYVITMLTSDGSGAATMARQVATIEGVSRIVWFGQSGRPALPVPSYLNHVLSQGATDSAQVRVLQTRLSQLGYDVHGIDGVFGAATASAVRAYQSDPAQHLTADGVVGPATGTALGIWR